MACGGWLAPVRLGLHDMPCSNLPTLQGDSQVKYNEYCQGIGWAGILTHPVLQTQSPVQSPVLVASLYVGRSAPLWSAVGKVSRAQSRPLESSKLVSRGPGGRADVRERDPLSPALWCDVTAAVKSQPPSELSSSLDCFTVMY